MTIMNQQENKDVINLGKIAKKLLAKKKTFIKVWAVVFVLSVIWIIPQPRYYNASTSVAPEIGGTDAGGLASLASSFGFNLGEGSSDAIYPRLYPDLMESNEFVVSLLDIKVSTDDGTLTDVDYYTYLAKHQKKNWLKTPYYRLEHMVKEWFKDKKDKNAGYSKGKKLDPFKLSEFDNNIVLKVKSNIVLNVDLKTDVTSIQVKDQDPLACALLADSVRQRLQDFITEYRTSKVRLDVAHYQNLADSAKAEYDKSVDKYSAFCDLNQDIILQSNISERNKLEQDMQMKYNTYTAMCTQLEMMKAKLQERTPAFTTLQSATVPVKPSGPKRLIFIVGMLVLSTFVMCVCVLKNEMRKLFQFYATK